MRAPMRPPDFRGILSGATEASFQSRSRAEKLRFDLVPPNSLAEVATALTVGCVKHGAENYLVHPREDEESRQMASLLRHLNADQRGEPDDADGFKHLAAVAARALMILEIRRRRK